LLDYGCGHVLTGIRRDLADFGVEYDNWYSERSLAKNGLIERALTTLRDEHCLYHKDGAEWFRSSAFGDEKDRVVIRDNGSMTYFASDIAYHADKYERGFQHVINVWGADHHGYVARIKAAITALRKDPASLEVLLVQFASLFRGREKVQMSTRAGEFVRLSELVEEVGRDAARFFYVTRRSDQHLDFDLELAKSRSSENPVYYVQYAHTRICGVFRQLEDKGLKFSGDNAEQLADNLTEEQERALTSLLSRYPDIVETSASNREPHQLANYLRELANEFHVYYNTHKIIVDDEDLRNARLALALAVKTVISSGLGLLGVIAALSVDSELRSAVPEPKFDFYKILPEIEVKVPEWEIKSDQSDQEQAFSPGTYVLQVGSFQRYADADRAKAKLALQGIRAKIQRVVINGQDVWFRVHVGPFTEMEKIKTMRMKLIESDMDFILLRIGEAQTT
jgi:arginyl-tRNA synthetase